MGPVVGGRSVGGGRRAQHRKDATDEQQIGRLSFAVVGGHGAVGRVQERHHHRERPHIDLVAVVAHAETELGRLVESGGHIRVLLVCWLVGVRLARVVADAKVAKHRAGDVFADEPVGRLDVPVDDAVVVVEHRQRLQHAGKHLVDDFDRHSVLCHHLVLAWVVPVEFGPFMEIPVQHLVEIVLWVELGDNENVVPFLLVVDQLEKPSVALELLEDPELGLV